MSEYPDYLTKEQIEYIEKWGTEDEILLTKELATAHLK